MIIATPDGKYHSVCWIEKDNYHICRLIEIPYKMVKDYCDHHDYVVFRPLTLREKIARLLT